MGACERWPVTFAEFWGPMNSSTLRSGQYGISIKPAHCFAGDEVLKDVTAFALSCGKGQPPAWRSWAETPIGGGQGDKLGTA